MSFDFNQKSGNPINDLKSLKFIFKEGCATATADSSMVEPTAKLIYKYLQTESLLLVQFLYDNSVN